MLSPQVATHNVFVASGDNPAGQADHESDDDVEPPLQISNLVLLLAFIPIVSELADLHQVQIHEILFVEMDTESNQNNQMMLILIMEMDAVINGMLRQGINVFVDLH